MLPFGDDRRKQINLGGIKTTITHASVLADASAERMRRQRERQAQDSASAIQAWWRGHQKGLEVRRALLQEFDREPVGSFESTRLLVLSGGERSRLNRWTQEALKAGELGIYQLMATPNADRWIVLLRQVAVLLLRAAVDAPLSPDTQSYLRVLALLVTKPKKSVISVPGFKLHSECCRYLLSRELYESLQAVLRRIPIEAKTNPALPYVVAISVSPFKAFNSTSQEYSRAFHQYFWTIFALPALSNRIPVSALTVLNTQFPFAALGALNVNVVLSHLTDTLTPIVLLSNLLQFMQPRYPLLTVQALETYLDLVNGILSVLPIGSLENRKDDEETTNWQTVDEDSDDELPPTRVRLPDSDTEILSAPLPILDTKVAAKLSVLVSPNHITDLLATCEKNPTTWKRMIAFLVNLCTVWHTRRGDVLICAVISTKGRVIKQLWREEVRSSILGKQPTDFATLRLPQTSALWPPLLLLTELYTQALLTMGDEEFFSTALQTASGRVHARNPLTVDEVALFSKQLLNIAFPMYWNEDLVALKSQVPRMRISWEGVRERLTKCLQGIHARDSRRPFTTQGHWLVTNQLDVRSFIEAAIAEEGQLDESDVHTSSRPLSKREVAQFSPRLGILNNIPFAIPFESRVRIFRSFIQRDQMNLHNDLRGTFHGRAVTIRRDHVSQDGFDHLNDLGVGWKGRLSISFVDQFGQPEAGIDGGGVFKEFFTSLSKEVFDTDRGLWLATKQQELYPNPHSYSREPHQLNWYRFIGRVLGKALYEGILVDVAFANFFLAKWLGKQSLLDDLQSLDPELYQGLTFLKHYSGKVEDLALNFTVAEEDLGMTHSINLKANGSNIPVTSANRLEYIYLVSYYRLTGQIKLQCQAFFEGLSQIIDPRWLRMFNQQELKILVGGVEEEVDLDDLRRNAVYGGLLDDDHPVIKSFWKVAKELNHVQRRSLLRFVTSCSRPPLLGFKELKPKFSIRDAGTDQARLPTASTCVNLLKLPLYQDERTLRQKLLHAINSGAGFDLS